MFIASLSGRATLELSGTDATPFLQNLITTDIETLGEDVVCPGALLSPQGKILFDFLLSRRADGFRIDIRQELAADFVKRLTLYRLRSKVEFSLVEESLVQVAWQTDSSPSGWLRDSRFGETSVWRHYGAATQENSDEAAWHVLRVQHGVGESGADYDAGDAFPHDVLLDQNGGVSFRKGCFVGQEVVSRMQHRGTARRRLLIARAEAPLPESGSPLLAGERPIGQLGTVAGQAALAMVRIDRAAQAKAAGTSILADGVPVELAIPEWARFDFPREANAEEDGPPA